MSTQGGNVTLILPPGSGPYDVKVNATNVNDPNGTVSDTVTSSPSARNLITVSSGGGDVTIS
jgi:hypothetical protein